MKCKIDITCEADIAAWVTKDAFMANVDQDDLAIRESQVVFDWYHPDWFRSDEVGQQYFTPPAFVFMNGHLLGINGRHRAILLFRHMDVIPMLLVTPGIWPKEKISEVVQWKIDEDEIVELPDLRIINLDEVRKSPPL